MSSTFSEGVGAHALIGLLALACGFFSGRSTGTPPMGGILGTVFVSKHTSSLLCPTLPAWPHTMPPSVSHLLSPKSPWHPTCLPLPQDSSWQHMQGTSGAFRARSWADFKGTFGPWSLLGMARRGFAGQRGAGVLVGFVPGAKKRMLFPWTKGLVPQGPDPAVGGCVAVGPGGCWKREQRVLTPHLWARDACGMQVTLWA